MRTSNHTEPIRLSNRTQPAGTTNRRKREDPINRRKRKRREESSGVQLNRTINYLPPPLVNLSLVADRVFDSWPLNQPLPCYPPENDWHDWEVARSHSDTGLLFMKPMKTGGSTAAGVHLRMAHHVARRQNQTFDLCKGRWDHAWGYKMIANRIPQKSFLWTIIREPTKRAISQFFHFQVSRENVSTSDEAFRKHLKAEKIYWNYYLRVLSTEPVTVSTNTAYGIISKILADYDFIAVTERFEESVVVLMMLLNLPMADVLYLSAKGNGNYDDGAHERQCFYIQPSVVSPRMEDYFASRQWQNNVRWDTLLHQAVNRSLDLTIDRLGRPAVETNLVKFRQAQQMARERCLLREVFPCTSKGVRQKNEKICLFADSGCGNSCLDEVATELGLWNYP